LIELPGASQATSEKTLSPPSHADDIAQDQAEPASHSFIIKVWVEDMALEKNGNTWRGHITHVISGTRRYLKSLGDVSLFIAPYIEAMGVRPRRRFALPCLARRR
jgi:hypothetical protein